MEFLARLEETELSLWLRESDWGHPIVLCFHAVGMGLVVGISLMFCARVLGYSKSFPLAGFDKLFGLAWFGFAMNAVSGVLLFIGEPRRLLLTPAFLIKMILIIFAGFSLWILARTLQSAEHPAGANVVSLREDVVSRSAKVAAIFPIVLWLGAIISGRLIGYTIGPPPI
jgi:hypothetical protein